MTTLELVPTRLDSDFNKFHLRNPSVYAKLRELALRLKRVGASKYGMKALFNHKY